MPHSISESVFNLAAEPRITISSDTSVDFSYVGIIPIIATVPWLKVTLGPGAMFSGQIVIVRNEGGNPFFVNQFPGPTVAYMPVRANTQRMFIFTSVGWNSFSGWFMPITEG